MGTVEEGNLIGFYANMGIERQDDDLIKKYLWGEGGLGNRLKSLKWREYGADVELILFEFYKRPTQEYRSALREIGSYRRKEKSIGIPVIVDDTNFFRLDPTAQQTFLKKTILDKLELLREKIKRNKLDLDLPRLKTNVDKLL